MFDIKKFQEYPEIQPYIEKLNKYLDKDKISKIPKILNKFENLIQKKEYRVPITYILSFLIEEYPSLISKPLLENVKTFITSENENLQLNSIIILGFYILDKEELISFEHIKLFSELLFSNSKDIKENAYFFLQKIAQIKPELICSQKTQFLRALSIEIDNEKNCITLLGFLVQCNSFNFKNSYKLREILIKLIQKYFNKGEKIKSNIIAVIKRFFPSIEGIDFLKVESTKIINILEKLFLMKKYDFSAISQKKNITFNEFREKLKKNHLEEKEIYFYTREKTQNKTIFYVLDRKKLSDFFDKENKISRQEILKTFSDIIKESDLSLFIETLIKINILNGYLSEFYYYPKKYILREIEDDYNMEGIIKLSDYNYLPKELVKKNLILFSKQKNKKFLINKTAEIFYSLSKIKQKINLEASNTSIIDLSEYRQSLAERSYLRLIKNLPKEYLTTYRKATLWLTNIGKFRIEEEIKNSKIIGFFDLERIAEKLDINKLFLTEIFSQEIDPRSGIWNREKNIFYYSKFLNTKIERISKIEDNQEKEEMIQSLARDLNVNRNHIEDKLDENLKSLGEEIKQQDMIKISEYLEKTGMNLERFMKFITNLGLNYFRQGDKLIFNQSEIEKAKTDIKNMLLQKSHSEDYITLSNIDIKSDLIKGLINDLKELGTLKGIFYEEGDVIKFYTERGIKNLMLENSLLFSLYDLFYGKELTKEELDLLKEIFYDLFNNKKLEGIFDEETLTFMNQEIIFANDYNAYLDEFEKTTNSYIDKFNSEFKKIKKILTKDEKTIYPQEIETIQKSIDKINEKYILWRSSLEAYIRRINVELLRKQGYKVREYRKAKEEGKEIKSFADDERVKDLMEGFNLWIRLFNNLELKYENIIYYKKHLKRKSDEETLEKLKSLMLELNLV